MVEAMKKSEAYRLRKTIVDLYGHIKNRLEVGGMPPITDALYSKAPAYMEIKDRAKELFDYIVDNDESGLAEVFAKLDENTIEQRFDQCFCIEMDFETQPEIRDMLNITNSIYLEMALLVRQCKEYVSDVIQRTEREQRETDGKSMANRWQTDGKSMANLKQTDTQSLNPEPQQELKDILPEQLKTDEAVKIFQKAIDAQLITNSPEGLKWNDTKQLLAYFATKVSDKFNLTTKLDKDGNKTTDWKTFETLFEQKGLKGAKQNWMRLNTKFEPTGFEKVDALF